MAQCFSGRPYLEASAWKFEWQIPTDIRLVAVLTEKGLCLRLLEVGKEEDQAGVEDGLC